MEQIAISRFKATCLAVLQRVRKSRKPVLVTRFGEPVAQIVPAPGPDRPKTWIGAMAGTGRIRGDIVTPASDEQDWEALSH